MRRLVYGLIGFCLLWVSSLGHSETLCYSLNNPGCIHKGNDWVGEVKCNDGLHECFRSDVSGVRAITILIHNYHSVLGISTLEEIIHRYGPKQDKYDIHRSNYILSTRELVGVYCGDDYRSVITRIVSAIIFFENGYIKEGLDVDKVVLESLKELDVNENKVWRCR